MSTATENPPTGHRPLPACPVCGASCQLLDAVDFNKSCEEQRGFFLPRADVLVLYLLCSGCGFCFAPDICAWPIEEFERRIYNDRYIEVDPDYVEARPRNTLAIMQAIFRSPGPSVRHLDYGGGNGLLSRLLREAGWNSVSYDPVADRNNINPAQLGRFELISAFEVFEHVPDVQALMRNLRALLVEDGLVIFSTLPSDGNIHPGRALTWWYASPRNGHISIFSHASLDILGQQNGFRRGSLNSGLHLFFKTIPSWAGHLRAGG
jgi:SAM-dependent methyltransferase